MLEEKIAELITVIAANTDALNKAYGTTHVSRETQEVESDAPATQKAKKKTAKKKTAKKSEPAIEEVESIVESVTPMDPSKVRTHLQGIMSQLKDASSMSKVIENLGASRLSDLDASQYPQLIKDAEQLLADEL